MGTLRLEVKWSIEPRISHCYEPRRKSIGTKRNDITDLCRELVVTAYGEFKNGAVYGDKSGIYCESKIFDTEDFGYQKIVVERPEKDENGKVVLKKGKPVADTSLSDTENVPLKENIDEYFKSWEKSIQIRLHLCSYWHHYMNRLENIKNI